MSSGKRLATVTRVWVALGCGVAIATGSGEPPTTSLPAASQPANVRIGELIRRLGDADFARREEAHRALAALGEAALPWLLEHIDDPDAEIAQRVTAMLPVPRAADQRVDMAMRLISTGRQEHLRRAVLLLFQEPAETYDLFRRAAAGQSGMTAAVCVPIVEQLDDWHEQHVRFEEHLERLRRDQPRRVSEAEKHRPDGAFLAESAFWLALDARDAYIAELPATRPAGGP